jgi:hypothetical protein
MTHDAVVVVVIVVSASVQTTDGTVSVDDSPSLSDDRSA